YIITNSMMATIQSQRKNDSLVLIDIAVPRDIEPGIDTIQDVFNYDVDDLKGLVDANLKQRQNAADEILQRIPAEIDAHNEWVNMLGVVPVIRALREKAMDIQEDTMSSIDRKLPGLTERERKVISKHTKSIINQMLKDPIKQAKELSSDKKSNEKLELFQNIFDIEAEQAYKPKEKKRNVTTTSQIFSFE
ncbi:glutamyl-tRNA reductase, partial [Staphylococcus ureilyticus]